MNEMLSNFKGQLYNTVNTWLLQEGFGNSQEFLSNNVLHQGDYKNYKIVLYKHYLKPEAFWCIFGIDVNMLQTTNSQHTFLGCVAV